MPDFSQIESWFDTATIERPTEIIYSAFPVTLPPEKQNIVDGIVATYLPPVNGAATVVSKRKDTSDLIYQKGTGFQYDVSQIMLDLKLKKELRDGEYCLIDEVERPISNSLSIIAWRVDAKFVPTIANDGASYIDTVTWKKTLDDGSSLIFDTNHGWPSYRD